MEGSNSRRIGYAKQVCLHLQIVSTVMRLAFHREVTPDGQRSAHKAGAFAREASPDSTCSGNVAIRTAEAARTRRANGLSAHNIIRARNHRTAPNRPSAICP